MECNLLSVVHSMVIKYVLDVGVTLLVSYPLAAVVSKFGTHK